MKISVIMPSYLGDYENSADHREEKFKRAVNSFLDQRHPEKELVIVSDGCDKTNLIYQSVYSGKSNIRLIKLDKQPLFSGNVREAGLKVASGKICSYLDTDDIIGVNHLSNIDSCFPDGYDWVYYNDFIMKSLSEQIPKIVSIEKGSIGTSSIAHLTSLRDRGLSWAGCDKYNHDFIFIERLYNKFKNYKKIYGCSYYICHIPNQVDY